MFSCTFACQTAMQPRARPVCKSVCRLFANLGNACICNIHLMPKKFVILVNLLIHKLNLHSKISVSKTGDWWLLATSRHSIRFFSQSAVLFTIIWAKSAGQARLTITGVLNWHILCRVLIVKWKLSADSLCLLGLLGRHLYHSANIIVVLWGEFETK